MEVGRYRSGDDDLGIGVINRLVSRINLSGRDGNASTMAKMHVANPKPKDINYGDADAARA